MIFVKRGSPARSPAASAPTSLCGGGELTSVITWPFASVFTAVLKNRRSNGDSGSAAAMIRRSNAGPSVDELCAAMRYPAALATSITPTHAAQTDFETIETVLTFTGVPPRHAYALSIWNDRAHRATSVPLMRERRADRARRSNGCGTHAHVVSARGACDGFEDDRGSAKSVG